jgi:uncharacterized protein YkwD
MTTLLRQATDSISRMSVFRLRRLAFALAFVCTAAWPAGVLPLPGAHAASPCDAVATPTADDTPSAAFGTDANAVSNFTAARQAEGCATPFTLPGNYDSLSPQEQMLALFNTERTDRGLGKLKLDSTLLSRIALNHSREFTQYGYFDHPSPINQPSAPADRWTVNPAIAQATFGVGEDISAGQQTAAEAVYGYMYQDSGSAWGHRLNILGAYDWIGIGIDPGSTTSQFAPYYTDDFLNDSPANPYAPPATADTTAPSLDAPTLAGSVATVTNVADQGDATAVTSVVFYTGSIVETGSTFNTVPAANQGNGTWTATLPAGSTGVLHAVAVDASGNYTDVSAGGNNTGGGNTTAGVKSTAGGNNNCASDGTCLTGLTASNMAPSAGASVTLTASTSADVILTAWYIDIVDEHGSVLMTCGSGTSCTANASSAGAATHQYTAWLSTSPTSISGGGPKSSTVAVTWH